MSRRRITLEFVPEPPAVELDPGLAHYLGRVLRLASGTEIDVVDASGGRWRGVVTFDAEGARVDALSLVSEPDTPEPLVVLASLIKQNAWEWMLEKATELGVTDIVPVAAARSVVRIAPEKAAAKQRRWQKICDSAVRQSERAHRVVVHEARSFGDALAEYGAQERNGGALIHFDETRPETPWPSGLLTGPITFVTGPEGGFTDAERALLAQHGATGVGLGPALLKAETATVAGLAYARLARAGLVP